MFNNLKWISQNQRVERIFSFGPQTEKDWGLPTITTKNILHSPGWIQTFSPQQYGSSLSQSLTHKLCKLISAKRWLNVNCVHVDEPAVKQFLITFALMNGFWQTALFWIQLWVCKLTKLVKLHSQMDPFSNLSFTFSVLIKYLQDVTDNKWEMSLI